MTIKQLYPNTIEGRIQIAEQKAHHYNKLIDEVDLYSEEWEDTIILHSYWDKMYYSLKFRLKNNI